jgi:hypothetical protein
MEKAQILKLASFISQGRVILFTGAGFSVGAKAKSGQNLPTTEQLSKALWQIAFPQDDFDGSSVGDVYDAAILQASKATQRKMRDLLTVDPNSLSESYRLWFSFPWHRIYTLNIDDLDRAVTRAFEFSRPLLPLSALTDSVPSSADDALQVVHLNGTLEDLPHVTFSSRQYGERLGRSDLWYDNLARELKTHPVLYVGTSLDEPPLWAYIEARGIRKTSNETRPGSFLVAPALPRARRVSLSAYNVSWVEAGGDEFAEDVLADLMDEAEVGRRAIEQRRRLERGGPPIARVSDLQNDSQNDEREFLHGREPRWSDLTQGYAVKRTFDSELSQLYRQNPVRLIVITGTAGSGKSTSAMRLALERSAEGDNVFALNADASGQLYRLRQAIAASSVDLLLIDDADRFGRTTSGFLHELLEDCPDMRIVVCIRNTRIQALDGLTELGVSSIEQTVPRLEDTDVESLLDALDAANRLGQLKGRTRKQQREAMQKTFGRQLLVALLEVTQGVRLEQKIERECDDLQGDAPLVYAVAALATYAGGPLTDQELIAASGDASGAKEQIDLLTRRHLLIRTSSGRLMPRHSVIAERVVRYYQDKGVIAQICTALAIGLASNAQIGELQTNRTGRMLIRLLNHQYLINLVYRKVDMTVDVATLRGIYDAVESVLEDDYQYWLQRGSFETEDGDLDRAKNFLDQARGMASSDLNVRAEWSYMTLKRASRYATDAGAADNVAAAFSELEDVIAKRGPKDYHAFHIYGSQGLAWARRAPLSQEEKRKLLEQLRRIVSDGLKLHPSNDNLRRLKASLDKEYMMLAVAG